MKYILKNWQKVALLMIMALAGFLTFYAIGQEGWANQYYSATVKSMMSSWHNFFFASFDPGGYVTVDKPALGLWLQTLSAKIFGFQGWSLILPEALSTVISVAVVYHIVKRFFGKTAGLLSALFLSLTPILIAVSRTNNLDASLVMVLLFAAWSLIVAAEKGSFKLLALSVVLVGLGFNIKMLEAFMVLPAFYLVYMFTAPLKIGKRIIQLAAATVILMVVSLSWAVAVDLTPKDSRPYIGSSQTNSVIELALGYNGLQRITGNSGNGGQNHQDGNFGNSNFQPPQMPQNNNSQFNPNDPYSQPPQDGNNTNLQAPPDISGNNADGADVRRDAGNFPGRFDSNRDGQGFGGGNFGGPGGVGENGQKGIFRIFNQQLSGQISWFLPMALFGIMMLYLAFRKKDSEGKRGYLRYLLLLTGLIVPMIGYFSIAGFFHRYYLSMLAPGLAMLSGIAIVEMWKAYMQQGRKWLLLPISLIVSAAIQTLILSRYSQYKGLSIVICAFCLSSAIALVVIRLLKKDNLGKTIKVLLAAGITALLIAPAIWSYTPIMYGSQTQLPVAGPELKRGNGQFGMPAFAGVRNENSSSSQLVKFLLSKKQNEKFLVAVSDAGSAESIIIETGEAVMAVGGFSGSDNILTVERLEQMVKNGELRYFEIGGRGMGQNSAITNWVAEHGKEVTIDDSLSTTSTDSNRFGQFRDRMGMGTLYDLAPEKN